MKMVVGNSWEVLFLEEYPAKLDNCFVIDYSQKPLRLRNFEAEELQAHVLFFSHGSNLNT